MTKYESLYTEAKKAILLLTQTIETASDLIGESRYQQANEVLNNGLSRFYNAQFDGEDCKHVEGHILNGKCPQCMEHKMGD